MTEQPEEPELFSDDSSAAKDFEAICEILDQRNILHDGVSLEGIFEIDDPFSFVAGTKNNPDVLSRSQMMKADDRDTFLQTEPKEIKGLIDAGVSPTYRSMTFLLIDDANCSMQSGPTDANAALTAHS
jgi:hypothetical protein